MSVDFKITSKSEIPPQTPDSVNYNVTNAKQLVVMQTNDTIDTIDTIDTVPQVWLPVKGLYVENSQQPDSLNNENASGNVPNEVKETEGKKKKKNKLLGIILDVITSRYVPDKVWEFIGKEN